MKATHLSLASQALMGIKIIQMDVHETYCDYSETDANIESLCCVPETNTMLYVNYVSIKISPGDQKIKIHRG